MEQLKNDLDPLSAQRYIYGEWVSLYRERIYYNYKEELNFVNKEYKINPLYPIDLMHDFNIGKGKPMSAALGQYVDGVAHLFGCFHVEGARTEDIMEEIDSKLPFDKKYTYRIFGDAAGEWNDTRSKVTDWEIIKNFLRKKGVNFQYKVPLANPPIRRRHNIVNAHFINENGKVRFYQYHGTKWVDEGWRLTSLKKGADYLEDDSLPQQHVTTAIGYWLDYLTYRNTNQSSSTIQL